MRRNVHVAWPWNCDILFIPYDLHSFTTCATCCRMTKALLDQRELLKSYRGQKPDISRPGSVPWEGKREPDLANRTVPLFWHLPRCTLSQSSIVLMVFNYIRFILACVYVFCTVLKKKFCGYQLVEATADHYCHWFLEKVIEIGLVLMGEELGRRVSMCDVWTRVWPTGQVGMTWAQNRHFKRVW